MYTGKTGGEGGGGESERTSVKILNKGSFRYTGFKHTLLLVDYDTNHADIEGTINNAIEHFLDVESFREEHKIF